MNRAGVLVDKSIQLLERDNTRRLGCKPNGEGFEELKKQAWFKNFDWDRLEDKELEPPFVPDVSFVFICFALTPHHPTFIVSPILLLPTPEAFHSWILSGLIADDSRGNLCRANAPTLMPLTSWKSYY